MAGTGRSHHHVASLKAFIVVGVARAALLWGRGSENRGDPVKSYGILHFELDLLAGLRQANTIS